jgi:hypothetical protein
MGTWSITEEGASTYLWETNYLPEPVMEWAGIKEREGHIDPLNHHLSMLNDDGASFAKIADIIDEYVDEL